MIANIRLFCLIDHFYGSRCSRGLLKVLCDYGCDVLPKIANDIIGKGRTMFIDMGDRALPWRSLPKLADIVARENRFNPGHRLSLLGVKRNNFALGDASAYRHSIEHAGQAEI